jgi:hypothetical protein
LKGYEKDDPTTGQVKPIPLPILPYAAAIAWAANVETSLAIANMMWLDSFFLLRPGKYTQPTLNLQKTHTPSIFKKSNSGGMGLLLIVSRAPHPFHIQEVQLW